jgi:tetratricopeptide (TPR) repeat protein
MPILRLTEHTEGPSTFRVEIAMECDALPRQTATSRFSFDLSTQDRERLRWYLEDYLQNPSDPAPKIAARIEDWMATTGRELFDLVFRSNDDARDLWATIRGGLNDTRVELVTGVTEAASVPWDLLRDPKTDVPLALRARSFVRTQPNPVQRPTIPDLSYGPIRVLLVICRPGGRDDVPFRSVASRLVKTLSTAQEFQLDVLRPPTFEQLGRVLRQAKAAGAPYHVVHFDGHGVFGSPGQLAGGRSRLLYADRRPGQHGYLEFEQSRMETNVELIDGPRLASLLVETSVSVLVLNACRSAHAEAPNKPETVHESQQGAPPDPHTEVRALGSLAQEVMDAGVAGVVAMNYNVYVVTAAQFVADLYAALVDGQALGEAVSMGRKQLHAEPRRDIGFGDTELQDWLVPVVYEAAPITLFNRSGDEPSPRIEIHAEDTTPGRSGIQASLPPAPDVGFFGRDETLLSLDRAHDSQCIVLLHAYAGSGKTATAIEFARWYALTGGIEGPVLFTSFERYTPLSAVLNQLGRIFENSLQQQGIQWLALSEERRRDVALQILRQVPVLWIWDNTEPVAGFPRGTASAWSADEQNVLAEFLRAARDTRTKFLLTSRRDEQEWLGNLPARVKVPPMPMQERVQLARALAEKYGHRLTEVEDWTPLLRYTKGNPLTIITLVGQVLRQRLHTKVQIKTFVEKLRAGEDAFEDEVEGRSKSLSASLSYGFQHAFDEHELKKLVLLHLFQGWVDVDVLVAMGDPDRTWWLPNLRGLTRDEGIVLLDRAAEVGLLEGHRSGYYSIHPVLPWYFKRSFDKYYPSAPANSHEPSAEHAIRAFISAEGALAATYVQLLRDDADHLVPYLVAEAPNLLYALHLARQRQLWAEIGPILQGLSEAQTPGGRWREMKALVEQLVPEVVDPATEGPVEGREVAWEEVQRLRGEIAILERNLDEAARAHGAVLRWTRTVAGPILARSTDTWDEAERIEVHNLAVSIGRSGKVLLEAQNPSVVETVKEAFDLFERLNETHDMATAALDLGNAYLSVPAIRDLDEAERWYQRSLDLRGETDNVSKSMVWSALGRLARQRLLEARDNGEAIDKHSEYARQAISYWERALNLLPKHEMGHRAAVHQYLAHLLEDLGELDSAGGCHRESIRLHDERGDVFSAAVGRTQLAANLLRSERYDEALDWARAALDAFQGMRPAPMQQIQDTQALIGFIRDAGGLSG